MKASKFSDAQKAFILKQGSDGVPVADICRKAGMSRAELEGHLKALVEASISVQAKQSPPRPLFPP